MRTIHRPWIFLLLALCVSVATARSAADRATLADADYAVLLALEDLDGGAAGSTHQEDAEAPPLNNLLTTQCPGEAESAPSETFVLRGAAQHTGSRAVREITAGYEPPRVSGSLRHLLCVYRL
jgi:hypothetical protein